MRISHSDKKIVVITGGDPSGVGPEIILKALSQPKLTKNITPLVIGDYSIFRKAAKPLGLDISAISHNRDTGKTLRSDAINFIDLENVKRDRFKFGQQRAAYGRASIEYLLCALALLKKLKNSSLVTAPVSKAAINQTGFKFSGHTEFLASLTQSAKVTMMLIGGRLKISLVTTHIPLTDVPRSLSKKRIIDTAMNTHYALRKFFQVKKPRIGVACLNPHGGEDGYMGKEEKSVIVPAIKYLRKKIAGVSEPGAADTLFYKAYNGKIDAVICMYHDQGMIPLKMTAFEEGVNLSVGLPFIRTSPDHGTAFDIAGRGIADPSSMSAAIRLAVKLS